MAVSHRLEDRHVAPRKASRWAKSSVLRILHNEMYAGVWHYNKLRCCEPKQPRNSAAYKRRLKSSVQRRPREEWIPLQLPESLRLVFRNRFERVQERLRQNIAFSRRNQKHFYLLKGLVRCNACGARYTGDTWHGRFYYRCLARCRKLPAIRDVCLDDLVVSALERDGFVPADSRGLRTLPGGELQRVLRDTISTVIFDGRDAKVQRFAEPRRQAETPLKSVDDVGQDGHFRQLFPTGEDHTIW
jgi:hypothetical protein